MEYLIISALGANKPNIVLREFSHLAVKNECNIEQSRMLLLGGEVAIVMLISGAWNMIAKVEAAIPAVERELDVTTITKRTKTKLPTQDLLPYTIQIFALDQPGIVFDLSNFFIGLNVVIHDMQSSNYVASLTETKMFNLTMRVSVPADTNIADFREQFAVLCEALNLDGILEPDKY